MDYGEQVQLCGNDVSRRGSSEVYGSARPKDLSAGRRGMDKF